MHCFIFERAIYTLNTLMLCVLGICNTTALSVSPFFPSFAQSKTNLGYMEEKTNLFLFDNNLYKLPWRK